MLYILMLVFIPLSSLSMDFTPLNPEKPNDTGFLGNPTQYQAMRERVEAEKQEQQEKRRQEELERERWFAEEFINPDDEEQYKDLSNLSDLQTVKNPQAVVIAIQKKFQKK